MEFLKKINISKLNEALVWSNVQTVIVFAILLGSGCIASSIAEKKGHSPYIHLAIGFTLPVLYPFYLITTMKRKEAKKVAEEVAIQHELEGTSYIDLNTIADLNADYFRHFPIDDTGTRPGPFAIETEDGMIYANSIIEIQEIVLIVETINEQSGNAQKLRVPYAKIIQCNKTTT